jgi:leucine-zipper of insertion element IS481/Integrase core domain
MKLHANAALSLNQRRRMVGRVVEQGWSLTKAAEAAEVSERTCSKWVRRYRALGEAGLRDRSSAPRSIPHRTPAERVEVIGVITGAAHRVTGRRDSQNANRRARRAGAPKGWAFAHVCIDDATRLAYAEVLADEKATTAVAFLGRAIAFYAAHGITMQRVMTDNGAAYRCTLHTLACRALGLRHLRTRPYRPHTTAKPNASSKP